MRKLIIMVIIILGIIQGSVSCVSPIPESDFMDGPIYTRVGIWYEHPKKILSTNYHYGNFIPAGTEVEIIDVGRRKIFFHLIEGENDEDLTIILTPKTTYAPMSEYYYRIFSKTNILTDDKFSEEERKNIKLGVVVPGMSKDAVIAAYGYPPEHETIDLTMDSWKYWVKRFNTKIIQFKGDRVDSVID